MWNKNISPLQTTGNSPPPSNGSHHQHHQPRRSSDASLTGAAAGSGLEPGTSTVSSPVAAKRTELRVYCDALMQQVHDVKKSVQEGEVMKIWIFLSKYRGKVFVCRFFSWTGGWRRSGGQGERGGIIMTLTFCRGFFLPTLVQILTTFSNVLRRKDAVQLLDLYHPSLLSLFCCCCCCCCCYY